MVYSDVRAVLSTCVYIYIDCFFLPHMFNPTLFTDLLSFSALCSWEYLALMLTTLANMRLFGYVDPLIFLMHRLCFAYVISHAFASYSSTLLGLLYFQYCYLLLLRAILCLCCPFDGNCSNTGKCLYWTQQFLFWFDCPTSVLG